MATKKPSRHKVTRNVNGKTPTLRAQNEQLQRELNELRKENRQLKKSLGSLLCKDDPVNMDLTPDDGVAEPSLIELIAKLKRARK